MMPSKKDRIIALVKERGPISGAAIYKAIRPEGANGGEVVSAIADEGGVMKDDGSDMLYVLASPQEQHYYIDQGYIPIKG